MIDSFFDYYRCPDDTVKFELRGALNQCQGYFRLSNGAVCYGRGTLGGLPPSPVEPLPNLQGAIIAKDRTLLLPFDPDEVAQNLLCELYAGNASETQTKSPSHPLIRDSYYLFRPLMPVWFRRILQRMILPEATTRPFPRWPVDRSVELMFEELLRLTLRTLRNSPVPFIWFWPEGAPGAISMTHDVETASGRDFCHQLMDLDDQFGFKSSFQIIPEERYEVTEEFLKEFRTRGFEINVHDLNHDGNLFRRRDEFLSRATKINAYAKKFGASGFRSGALYRNMLWYDAFEVAYDMSAPNVGHLDPQGGGCCSIMPYFVDNILEIPVTTTQDYSLFHILQSYDLDLWKSQITAILAGHGLISVIIHPDYVIAKRARQSYLALLAYLSKIRKESNLWTALPSEINRWWRLRDKMKLVRENNQWKITGEGRERARVALAHLVDGRLTYTITDQPAAYDVQVPVTNPPTTQTIAPVSAIQGESLDLSKSQAELGTNFGVSGDILNPALFDFSEAPPPTSEAPDSISEGRADAAETGQGKSIVAVPTHPLRVAMVSYSFYETDNRVMRYAETLAARGDRVEVFALRRGELPKQETLDGVTLHRIQGRQIDEKNRFSYLFRITQFLFRAMYQLATRHLKEKYDFIHVHSVPDYLVFTAVLPRLAGTPVVLDIHDILPEFYLSKFGSGQKTIIFNLLLGIERISAAFSSHVIIANHIWQKRLVRRSVRTEKCSVVMNSPDRTIFHVNEHEAETGGRFKLIYPGTLNWHQGLDLAIRAFGRIAAEVPEADFHIYGDGPSRESLVELVQQLDLTDRIFFHKPMPLREIAKVMQSADLGVVPKRKDAFGNEAFSTKILEFMAVDVPVIVSDTQIDRFYFDDSVVRFFEGGNEESLRTAMLDLIRNKEERERIVRNSREYVKSVDWTAKKKEYLTLVDNLVARK